MQTPGVFVTNTFCVVGAQMLAVSCLDWSHLSGHYIVQKPAVMQVLRSDVSSKVTDLPIPVLKLLHAAYPRTTNDVDRC
jgi:hypothetical protein